MEIIFATSNANKLREVRSLLPDDIMVLSLKEINFKDEIEETKSTIEGNSSLKAKTIFDIYKKPVLAEDTGLEVFALNGEPGVRTARYSGDGANAEKNMNLLLKNLKDESDRSAQFKTVATFISANGGIHTFEGIIRGVITSDKMGEGGFGYDPIFKPAGFSKVFADMADQQKNIISHRGIAITKFIRFLKEEMTEG